MEKSHEISEVTYSKDDVKISLIGIPDKPGIASKIFNALANRKVNVDMILQNVSREEVNDITFTIAKDDLNQTKVIVNELQKELSIKDIEFNSDIAVVSIIGAGMATSPGVANRMFESLAEENINIEMISTSEIKISCLVDKSEAEDAVKAIRNKFDLKNDK